MTLRQRVRFYQQLAVLLRAGLPIRGSIDRLRERMRGAELTILSRRLGEGERLGEAFHAAHFLPFESNLVVAGERSGQLETIFDHIAQFWQRELEFRQALVRPLIYPIVVTHLAVAVSAAISLVTLPWPAVVFRFVVTMAILYALGIGLYLVARFSWGSPAFRRFWLFLPIIGRALKTTFAYRWITTLRLEFTAGVSLYRAIGDAWRASGFIDCERLGSEAEEAMRSGAPLSALMLGWTQLPRDWIDFFETGEVSGGFEAAFKNLEAEAAREWTMAQQRMAEWVPKIVYFFVLIFAASQVFGVLYQVGVTPIVNAEKQIDDATGGN